MKSLTQRLDLLDQAVQKKTKQTLGNLIFWCTFLLLLVIHCIENTSVISSGAGWLRPLYLFRNFLYLVMIVKTLFFARYRTHELIGVLFLYLMGTLSFLCSRDFSLMECAIVAVGAKDVLPKQLAVVFGTVKAASIPITLFLYALGVLPELIYDNGWGEIYNTYGFCHRNVLGVNIACLCLVWFCLRFRRMNLLDALLWGFFAFGSYYLTYSKTSILIMGVIVVGAYIFRSVEEYLYRIPHFDWILCGLVLLLLAVSFLGTVLFEEGNAFWELVDDIFTKRFRFANQCFESYGITLFGQRLPFVSTLQSQYTGIDRLILDNSYMRVLLYNGLLPGITFLLVYLYALKKTCERRDGALLFGLLIMALYGMSERFMLDINYNVPLLAASVCCFYRIKKKKPTNKRRQRVESDYKMPLAHACDLYRLCAAWIQSKRR